MLSTTEQQIEDAFLEHATVERVKKIRDYAFVHFHSKEDAHNAMEAMNGVCVCVCAFVSVYLCVCVGGGGEGGERQGGSHLLWCV